MVNASVSKYRASQIPTTHWQTVLLKASSDAVRVLKILSTRMAGSFAKFKVAKVSVTSLFRGEASAINV